MKTISLCGRGNCCPRLVVEIINGKKKFHIINDDEKGTTIILKEEYARNLAMQILQDLKQ